MKRILNFKQGIVCGDTVRDIIGVFPEIENRFRQRKTYDEYYFDGATVELTIDIIRNLNQLGFEVSINWEEVVLS
jgi:hypothetical protein